MNINGLVRGQMARTYSEERFLLHVATCIEQQLQEWDARYEVIVMKLKDYELIVKDSERDYQITIAEKDIAPLQQAGPYSLDQKCWKDLEAQGLPIVKGFGNYIEMIL
ncbi:hypothetical protein [Bacillus rubiinfantis]|uniref:hypothetical protein n=1 Tax=Bacillus rubiinfantis TaxID=1499680 RepID=UPI0005A9D84E|nr:hypothetical protein [Bacillus rubiinfantis]